MTDLANTDPALRRAWHPVARAEDLADEPVSVRVLGDDWVLVRLGRELAAFPDRCPHRLAPLSAGWVDAVEQDGQTRPVLRCGYHGWCFAADGGCVEIPALADTDRVPPRARLAGPAALTERYGLLWLAPEAPLVPLLEVPEADDPAFTSSGVAAVRGTVGAGLMIDNFLDMAHFPFVHPATIGTPDSHLALDRSIERDGLTMTVRAEHEFANHTDPSVAAGERPLTQRRRLQYTYAAPFSIRLRIDYLDADGVDVIVMFVQPEDDQSCVLHQTVLRSGPHADADTMAALTKYELRILDEDLRVQERYVDHALPLDLTTEVHTKADQATMELRRILADLVAAAATPGG